MNIYNIKNRYLRKAAAIALLPLLVAICLVVSVSFTFAGIAEALADSARINLRHIAEIFSRWFLVLKS